MDHHQQAATPNDSLDGEENEDDEDDEPDLGDEDPDEEDYPEADAGDGLQRKVYVDYPLDNVDDEDYRFVSSRIGEEEHLEDAGAGGRQRPARQRAQDQRYQAVAQSPTDSARAPLHSHREEPLPVYGRDPTTAELAEEIRYQSEMQRRLERMAGVVARLEQHSGGEPAGVPRLDLLHMEEPTASQHHLYRDSLDIDLRDNDTEETEDDEDQQQPATYPQHHHAHFEEPPGLSSNRRAEIAHVSRLSKQLGGLQIEPDFYDSGRNPPSESAAGGGYVATGRTPAAAVPTAEDLEFLRKLRRDLVYGGQAGPHRQMISGADEGAPIRPESLRQPLPQVTQVKPTLQQPMTNRDFVEDNKRLPPDRLPKKSYGRMYQAKREKPHRQQPPRGQRQQPADADEDEGLEVTRLDQQQEIPERTPPERVWLSRMAALQTAGGPTSSGPPRRKGPAAATATAGSGTSGGPKQASADPRLQQKLQHQRQQAVAAEEMLQHRHSVPVDQMFRTGDPAVLTPQQQHPQQQHPQQQHPQQQHPQQQPPPPQFWPYPQQQQHFVTAFDINGQPVAVPVPQPPMMPQMMAPPNFYYPYGQPYSAAASAVYPVPMPPPAQPHPAQFPQQYQQLPLHQSPRPAATGASQETTAQTPRLVIDESALNRQFKYVGTKMAGMSRSPPGKYNPLPPIAHAAAASTNAAAATKKIDSRELDKLTKTIISGSTGAGTNRDQAGSLFSSSAGANSATQYTSSISLGQQHQYSSSGAASLWTDATVFDDSEEVSGYSAKFQQTATSPTYTPYSVGDFQNVKSVGTLGGLGHDKENEGYRISHQLYKKKQQYAKAIGDRNRANLEAGGGKRQPQPPRRQEEDGRELERQPEPQQPPPQPQPQPQQQPPQQPQQQPVDAKPGRTLNDTEAQAKREAQEKRQRMKEYSRSLHSTQQQQQQQHQSKAKGQPQAAPKSKPTSDGFKASAEVNKLLHDPELELLKQRHLEDKKRSDSIRQQIAAS